MNTEDIVRQIFVVLVAAQLAALLFRKLRQPVVVGEILAGVLIGPSVLGLLGAHGTSGVVEALGELGVVVLMFLVGLETPVASIKKVGPSSLAVAAAGVVLPFGLGWAAMQALGHGNIESLFVGTALVATSVGVTARVLGDLGVLDRDFSRVILGAAVIDDILGLLVLAVVRGVAREGVSGWEVGGLLAMTIVFVGVLLTLGPHVVRRTRHRLTSAEPTTTFLVSMVLVLGLAYVAAYIELAAIVGAFLAGVVLAETTDDTDLTRQVEVLGSFLTPFFFVGVGAAVELDALATPSGLALTALIVLLAIVGKLVGCGLAARACRSSVRDALTIGIGMAPRGEVGIIVAQLALASHAVTAGVYGVVVATSVLTTLVAPPFLALVVNREPAIRADEHPAEAEPAAT